MTNRVSGELGQRAPVRRSADAGSTFIELLVSIVLIGTAGVAVLAALAAATTGSAVHEDVSEAQTWLANVGDALIEVDSDFTDGDDRYTACDEAGISDWTDLATRYQNTIVDPLVGSAANGTPVTISDIKIENLGVAGDATDDTFVSFASFADCAATNGGRLQQITLQTVIDGSTRTLTVVKRPALPPTVNTGVPPTTLGGGNVLPPPTPCLPPNPCP